MPMPPPKPSAEPRADPRVRSEVDQLVRALRAEGPAGAEELGRRVGATYWDAGRFEDALSAAVRDGLVIRAARDRYVAP